MTETIFALSSGRPPAAIAVVRITGPRAHGALERLAGRLPEPRQATLVTLRDGGDVLDRALALRFDAPRTVTGEDMVELHLHGGRAVVDAVSRALAAMQVLRPAVAGEFTRRAFANGKIDLTEAEGLADLLAAETETQRRAALNVAGGALSRLVQDWTSRLLALAAEVESQLDFSDEGDVEAGLSDAWQEALGRLQADMAAMLARPPAERLRDGIRTVIAGPPNSGKSSLLNMIAGRDAAIISPVAGTTRDLIEVPLALGGLPFLLIDSAGLRESDDEIEAIGIARTAAAMAAADILLWLGEPDAAPSHDNLLLLHGKADLGGKSDGRLSVSARTGQGIDALFAELQSRGHKLLPREDEVAMNDRHRAAAATALHHLNAAEQHEDLLLIAEELRQARVVLDGITGRAGVEHMLDALFGRFCIGK